MSTILVVDDEPVNRELLATLLRYDGHRIVEAADGVEALAIARSEHPALVISDLVMPRMDGYQFVRHMRLEQDIAQIPVLFYTANYFEPEAKRLASACGVRQVLTKPAEPETLLGIVRDALRESVAGPAAPIDEAVFDREHVRVITDKLHGKVAELEAARHRLRAVIEIVQRLNDQNDAVKLFDRFVSDAREIVGARTVSINLARRGETAAPPPGALDVPLASASMRYGTVRFAGKIDEAAFTEEDQALARSLAAALSVTYENILRYDAVSRHAVQLERSIAERTAELQRSNEELEQFAYVASHDLQEPLRMVASYMQLLEKRYGGRLDADADEFIRYAVDGATRMQRLIRDLLAYSRVGAPAAIEVVDVGAVVDAALQNLAGAIADTGATVTRDVLPSIASEHAKLAQLFQNLIGNAIKFHGSDPPVIHVGAHEENDGWTFSVRDNGIGIEPQYLDRIFVIFQRLHARDAYPGTGIGLALCKRIVTRLGGRIRVESEPARGSTFFVFLPTKLQETASR